MIKLYETKSKNVFLLKCEPTDKWRKNLRPQSHIIYQTSVKSKSSYLLLMAERKNILEHGSFQKSEFIKKIKIWSGKWSQNKKLFWPVQNVKIIKNLIPFQTIYECTVKKVLFVLVRVWKWIHELFESNSTREKIKYKNHDFQTRFVCFDYLKQVEIQFYFTQLLKDKKENENHNWFCIKISFKTSMKIVKMVFKILWERK